MKRLFLLLSAAALVFATAGAQVKTADAKKATSAIKIDGVLDDAAWATATKYTVGGIFKGETITDSADCSGFFQVLWADSGIFVGVTVTDDKHVDDLSGKYGPDWAQDLVEVYFDMNSNYLVDGRGVANGGSGHYCFANAGRDTTYKDKGAVWTYKHTGDHANYIKEVYVPWTYITDEAGNVFKPNKNVTLGFDVDITDNDSSYLSKNRNWRDRKVWSNIGNVAEDYSNMDDAGRLTFSDAPALPIQRITMSTKTSSKIKVDGVLDDAAWKNAVKYPLTQVFKGETINGDSDCSAYFQTLWCDSGVFVAVTVADDKRCVNLASTAPYGPSWAQDLAEVYFDMNPWGLNDGQGPAAGGSGHYCFADPSPVGADTVYKNNGAVWAYHHTGWKGYYTKEVFAPWKFLTDADGQVYKPNGNDYLGFDVCIADNDTSYLSKGRNYRDRLLWSNIGNVAENYSNMDDAGKIKFVGAAIPANMTAYSVKATKAIKLDGKLDDADWKTAKKYRLGQVFKGETISGPNDCSAYFQTVWADSGIFVAVSVKDDKHIDGYAPYTWGGQSWCQDLAEVYFDMNVAKLKDGNGVAAGKGHYCSADEGLDTTYSHADGSVWVYKHSGANYIKEVYFPWTVLKDSAGSVFAGDTTKALGFDVCISDNDSSYLSKNRNYRDRLMWSNIGNIKEDYSDMDDAGRLFISGGIPQIKVVSVAKVNAGSLTISPNPAYNTIRVSTNSANPSVVNIFNVEGQLVKTSSVTNNGEINISGLKQGVYFVRVADGKNVYTGKLIKK